MQCRYAGTCCRGCHSRIAFGAPVYAGGSGLVHDDARCLRLATDSLAQESAAPLAPAAAQLDPADDLVVGRSLASFISLETEFVMETGSGRMADCLLPRDDAGAFDAFLRWAVERCDEADTWSSLWRAASTLMARTRGRDLTEHATACRTFDELSSRFA